MHEDRFACALIKNENERFVVYSDRKSPTLPHVAKTESVGYKEFSVISAIFLSRVTLRVESRRPPISILELLQHYVDRFIRGVG